MGNNCQNCQQSIKPLPSFINMQTLVQPQPLSPLLNCSKSIKVKAKSTFKSIRIDRTQPIQIKIFRNNQLQMISIPLENMQKKLTEYQQQQPKISIYFAEFGLEQKRGIKQGAIIEYAIINSEQSGTSIIAFAGEYLDNKKQRGIYILLKSDEAFMFHGVFTQYQRKGIRAKIGLNQNEYEKCWGCFNSNFELNGKGETLVYVRDLFYQQKGQYHYFNGIFQNGVRQGEGIFMIRDNDAAYKPYKQSYQEKLQSKQIKDIQDMLLTHNESNYTQLNQKLIQLLIILSQYSPSVPDPINQQDCKLIVQGAWHKGLIQGLTEERWPQKRYRFYGVYKDNQRNGYGEQYLQGQKIAKGFYKKGTMETDRQNQFLLLGFRLINGAWKRTNQ